MNKKIFAALGIVALLVALLPASVAGADQFGPPDKFPRNNMAPPGLDPMDLSVERLGEKEIAIRKHAAEVGSAVATNASPIGEPAVVGDEFVFTVSDDGKGIDYDEDFVVVKEGEHILILVTKDAYDSFLIDGNYHFANPIGDDSELWLRSEDVLTPAQLDYLLYEFDNTIWPSNTTIYGEPLPRGDEGQKIWTLIFNIRDEAYYDTTAESYIAGYFSASESAENNKNIMHIDSYDWANRTGPDAARPFLYEGTFAHEFEHLIHFDIDPDEPSWVDEGLADLAGYFCGYGHSSDHIAYYMVYHPITALTFWGNGLEDYGASYLFQLYLYEKYGGAEFTSALVQEQANGIDGIENTLAAFGYNETFNEIFDDWTIANYIDDTSIDERYGYDTLTIGSEDSWGYSIEYALQNFWVGDPLPAPIGFYSSEFFGAPMPYTAQYYDFGGQPRLATAIDGDELAGTPAYSGTQEWYSGMDAWAWRSFYQAFSIPATGATLNFMTYYDIEEDWDYGYVEVYDQDTDEWFTLEAPGMTVDYIAHPQNNPNTPDGREPVEYCDPYQTPDETMACNLDTWHAFTGYSGDWVPITMDLDPFAGHTIELYFTTWQDGAFTLQMMYVDDIAIPEIGFFDDVEAGEDGWASTGWTWTDGILLNNWQATLLETLWQPTNRYPVAENWHARKLLDETHMVMDTATQSGEITDIAATPVGSRRTQVLIVSNRSDHILTADYWVQFTK
jgi:hypothetical protein